VPSKASHANGNGRCKVHPRNATACRPCLVEHLQEFRHANVRTGIRLAVGRISSLLDQYTSRGASPVSAAAVARNLNSILGALEKADQQVAGLPVDAGVMCRLTREVTRNQRAAS
jgi:hypothetical protein